MPNYKYNNKTKKYSYEPTPAKSRKNTRKNRKANRKTRRNNRR